MPQLIPFYFVNQVASAFILLLLLIYIFSKFILPLFIRLYIIRVFIKDLKG